MALIEYFRYVVKNRAFHYDFRLVMEASHTGP